MIDPEPAASWAHPTDAQIAVFRALEDHGSLRRAAESLGLPYLTARNRLIRLREVMGVQTNVQLATALRERGFIA